MTPEYFSTTRIAIVEGRGFDGHDDEHGPKVAVVTRRFAEQVWPGMSAVGKRFRLGKDGPSYDVVGVSADIQYFSIGELPKAFFFRPYAQNYRSTFTLNVLTAADPGSLTHQLRSATTSLDPALCVFEVRTMHDHVINGRALLGTRIGAVFAGVFGLLALILASAGVYGLISHSVAQRTREIGIRVALERVCRS